jgi:multidrug efflux system membrane fusion protein
MKVEVVDIELLPMAREIILQGQLEARRQLLVRAKTSGTVDTLEINKGERVAAGASLVTLDLNSRETSLSEAHANVKTAQSEQQAALTLRKQGLQSQVQLEQAEARLEAARAALARIELDISYTKIIAPFAGVINGLPVEVGDLIERGGIVAELVDDSSFRVTAQAAQQTIAEFGVGQKVTVRLITGQVLPGTLTFIASVADSATRSFTVEAEVANPAAAIAAGVSASLVVPVEQVEAAFITPSALALGNDGELGVKTVDTGNKVVFIPIELVSTTLDGAWVTGIADASRVITLGQGFVNVGEVVDPQTSTPATPRSAAPDGSTSANPTAGSS